MKLVRYMHDGVKTGLVVEDAVVDTGFHGPIFSLIEQWSECRTKMEAVLNSGPRIPLDSVKLCAPIQRPGKIFAIGLNYADHCVESGIEVPSDQLWFTKAQTSINGPFDPILITSGAPKVDYEAELVVVIGKRAKHISPESAADYVFGYCVGNDVTERAWQLRTPQWSLGKSFDTHAPIGPWITTFDEVEDPHMLDITCHVNGELRQKSNTRHLVFNIWQQIAHLSSAMTLEPGDLIFTGTPSGVGVAMKPRQFLKAGDTVRCEIGGLGVIEACLEAEVIA